MHSNPKNFIQQLLKMLTHTQLQHTQNIIFSAIQSSIQSNRQVKAYQFNPCPTFSYLQQINKLISKLKAQLRVDSKQLKISPKITILNDKLHQKIDQFLQDRDRICWNCLRVIEDIENNQINLTCYNDSIRTAAAGEFRYMSIKNRIKMMRLTLRYQLQVFRVYLVSRLNCQQSINIILQ